MHQPGLCIKEGILSPDVRSFLFASVNFACMLGSWCKHAAELQLLRSQHWQPCHLSLSAWLSNTTHLLGKRSRDMNASLFFNIANKNRPNISLSPFPYKKDGLLLNDKWEKRWEMVGKQVVTKWSQGPSMQAIFMLRKKTSNIRAKYTSVQNGGVMKRAGWCTRPHHFVRGKIHWNPVIL